MKTSTLMTLVSFMCVSNSIDGGFAMTLGLLFGAYAIYLTLKEEKETEGQV
jgi:hypothetical protein